MNKDVLDSMKKQMNPSPEVRAALEKKLARPAKRPVRKYVAVAACAALVIGGFSVYSLYQDQARWMLITENFHRDAIVSTQHLHSYVTADESTTLATGAYVAESGIEGLYRLEGPDRGSDAPNTGDLPSRESADVPVQEGAEDYQALMDHFSGTLPDWYGGGYLDAYGRLVVLLVEDQDPGDKSLELQIQNWTGSERIRFGSAKYSMNQLNELMDQLNQLPDADLKYADVMARWGIDEEYNRVELTLTQVYEPILSVLAELDPEDDAIYVQVGQRAAVYAVRDSEAVVPEGEELDPSTAVTYDPRTGETIICYDSDVGSENPEETSGGTRAYNPDA